MTEAGVALQTHLHKPEIEMDGDSLQEGIAVLTRRLMEHESPCGEHGVVIAVGARENREQAVLAVDMGASEERAFWTALLRGLTGRGPTGYSW